MNDIGVIDKTALSYWFPKLEAAGLPVPKTRIVQMPRPAQECAWASLDGADVPDEGTAAYLAFVALLCHSADDFGYPCFLRTDHTSGKHRWKNTCFIPDAEAMGQHVFNLVEESALCDLPDGTWAVRELLPTKPFTTCPLYGDMPVCREFRVFVDGAAIKCWHAYWPETALAEGGASLFDYAVFCDPGDSLPCILELASRAGRAIGGEWSVDILDTEYGWFVTDMAEAAKSFHWAECERARG